MFNSRKRSIKIAIQECHKKAVTSTLSIAQRAQSGDRGFNVLTTLRASKVIIQTPIGTIEIGLSGFRLVHTVQNGKFSTDAFPKEIDPEAQRRVSVTRQVSDQLGTANDSKLKVTGVASANSVGANVTSGAEVERDSSRSASVAHSESSSYDRSLLTIPSAGETEFELAVQNIIGDWEPLNQKLYEGRLCYVAPIKQAEPVKIFLQVRVTPKQFWLGSGTGIFEKELHENKKKIIKCLVSKLVESMWTIEGLEIPDA